MNPIEACGLILLFFAYSFLGWCCECLYCALGSGKLVNRGFLNGPLCPVYGFGALTVLFCLAPVSESPILVFLWGMLVTSLLEYLTAWLLETIFHAKWWDYSSYRFNLHGRVCLRNSILFGLLSVATVFWINPAVSGRIARLPAIWMVWWASACTSVFVVDLFLSVRTALELAGKLQLLHEMGAEIRSRTEAAIREGRMQAERMRGLTISEQLELLAEKGGQDINRLHEQLARATRSNLFHRRLLGAFPNLRPQARHEAALFELKVAIERRKAGKERY